MAEKTIEEKRAVRKFICITDADVWDMIDKIMELPDYSKSFNKVINHALKYGVVELYGQLFLKEKGNSAKISQELSVMDMKEKSKEDMTIEDCMFQIVEFFKEDILNLTMIKALVCSLYDIKYCEIKGEPISPSALERGWYFQTPKFLESYEARALKNLRGGSE